MKVLVIVPAFNEQGRLGQVLDDLHKYGYRNILVVNDGSQDDTGNIARQKKVLVATHVVNRGLGAAIATGLAHARETLPDVAVTFDADGQHKASELKKLIGPIEDGKADVVIGSRIKGGAGKIPKRRLLPILFSNIGTFLLYGIYFSDTTSGLRAFNRKAIELIRIKSQRMEFSNEFFKEFVRNKLRVVDVPIAPIYTKYSMIGSKQGSEFSSSLKLGFKLMVDLLK